MARIGVPNAATDQVCRAAVSLEELCGTCKRSAWLAHIVFVRSRLTLVGLNLAIWLRILYLDQGRYDMRRHAPQLANKLSYWTEWAPRDNNRGILLLSMIVVI